MLSFERGSSQTSFPYKRLHKLNHLFWIVVSVIHQILFKQLLSGSVLQLMIQSERNLLRLTV